MPSRPSTTPSSHRKIWVIAAILLAFVAGLLVSRARYKPQIRATFDMVQEREDKIRELREVIKSYEKQMMQPNRK